jgi:flagellar assembly protein FliH
MSGRVNVAKALVVPWQVPDIDGPSDTAAKTGDFRELDPRERASPLQATADPVASTTPQAASTAAPSPPQPVATEEIVRQAREAGFAQGLREGREHGYAEGLATGRRDAEQHLAEEIRLLETIVRRLGEPTRALERPVEEAVIALALEIARWVIGTEVSRSSDYLVGLIREAVAKVPLDVGTPAIILNPLDLETVRGLAPDLETNGIPLVGDDSIEPGGCLVIADGAEGDAMKDRRWHPRAHHGISEVDLTLASRWRNAMFAMFEGEEA